MEINEKRERELNETISPNDLLDSEDSGVLIPPTPSHIPIEHGDEQEIKRIQREKEKILYRQLAKYCITKEEWEEISKYKGDAYFLLATMLHKVDLYQYNMPRFSDVFENPEFFEPEKIMDAYCKIYSAMCKFSKRNNQDLHICRVDSDLFSDEMKKSGQTESLLSFSKGKYDFLFFEGKNNPVLLNGLLKKGTPCIDFNEFVEDAKEAEILVPPFLHINYYGTEEGEYPTYHVEVSRNGLSVALTDEEKENMELLRQSVLSSRIAYEYYQHWYYDHVHFNIGNSMSDEKTAVLREEFFKWQENLRKYLQFKFREIEHEIEHPRLKPADFLMWGIERGKQGADNFKAKMQQVNELFHQFITSKEDERGR